MQGGANVATGFGRPQEHPLSGLLIVRDFSGLQHLGDMPLPHYRPRGSPVDSRGFEHPLPVSGVLSEFPQAGPAVVRHRVDILDGCEPVNASKSAFPQGICHLGHAVITTDMFVSDNVVALDGHDR